MATKYDLKMQRRREAEAKEKREKAIMKVVGILLVVAIVIGIAMIPISSYMAKNSAYITVDGDKVTRVEFDYYYNMAKNDYVNMYGSYLAYMGLDLSQDLSTQEYSEDMSWKDYFEERAVDSIKQNRALLAAAAAEGFTYDVSKDMETYNKTVKDAAKSSNMSVGDYYKTTYGKYASTASVKPFVEDGYKANAYYKAVLERKAPSDAEIETYYKENAEDYDLVDYRITEVEADIPEAEGDEEVSDEVIAEAMAVAKANAEDAEMVIEEEGIWNVGMSRTSLVTAIREWLFDDARVENDTTVIEDADNHKYYALQFCDRYLEDSLTANVRVITTSTVDGESILAEYNTTGANEEAFIALVDKYSDDTYSVADGGLYKEITSDSMDSEVSQWIFDERKTGDVTVIAEDGVTYVVYYVGKGREEWKKKISDILQNDAMTAYMDEITEALVVDPKNHLEFMKEKPAPESEENTESTEVTE